MQFTSSLLDEQTGLLTNGNFGDWLAVLKVDNDLVSNAFFVRNLNVAAAAARVIGLESDAAKYDALAKSVSQAYVKQWWNATAQRFQTAQGLQTALALPLFAGICGASNISAACGRALADITVHGECQRPYGDTSAFSCLYPMHVTGGIMGAEALLPALSMAGYGGIALAVALQTQFPSWAAMTRDGSGTLWERWDGDLSDPEGSSRNHVMFASVRTWAGAAVAGISPLAPGWSSVLVAPDWRIVHSNTNNVSTASCSVFAPAGTVSTSWSSSSQTSHANDTGHTIVRVVASLPPTVSGIVCVPCFDCRTAIITESSVMVWNGSSGFVPGVSGIRSADLQSASSLVNWPLIYPGAGAAIVGEHTAALSTCFEIDSGSYVFACE